MQIDQTTAAKILTALEASRDFLEIMRQGHQAGSVLPTASTKVISQFESALAVASQQVDEAIKLVLPVSQASAFIFSDGSPGKSGRH